MHSAVQMNRFTLDVLLRPIFVMIIGLYHLDFITTDNRIFPSGYLLVEFFFVLSGASISKVTLPRVISRYSELVVINLFVNIFALLFYFFDFSEINLVDFMFNSTGFSFVYGDGTQFNYVSWFIGVFLIVMSLQFVVHKLFKTDFQRLGSLVLTLIVLIFVCDFEHMRLSTGFDFVYGIEAVTRCLFSFLIGQIFALIYRRIELPDGGAYRHYAVAMICTWVVLYHVTQMKIGLVGYLLILCSYGFLIMSCRHAGITIKRRWGKLLSNGTALFFVLHPLAIKAVRLLFDQSHWALTVGLFIILSSILVSVFYFGLIYAKRFIVYKPDR